jgi:hypothetical protein
VARPFKVRIGALTRAPVQRISRDEPKGARMGWYAIGLIVLFIVAIAAINRIEFGRFD